MHPLRLLDRIRWALDERFELQHELQVLEHEISIHATPNFRGVDRVDLVFKRRAFDSSPVDADDDQDDDEDAHIVRLSISVYSQAQALASLKEADLDEKDQTVFVLTFSQLMA
jgi:DNA-directed RNA polymerase specialized sigma subunit